MKREVVEPGIAGSISFPSRCMFNHLNLNRLKFIIQDTNVLKCRYDMIRYIYVYTMIQYVRYDLNIFTWENFIITFCQSTSSQFIFLSTLHIVNLNFDPNQNSILHLWCPNWKILTRKMFRFFNMSAILGEASGIFESVLCSRNEH